MRLVPKMQHAYYGKLTRQKAPLVLNEEGEAAWRDEHPDEVELPEITVTADRPLTELEQRDKANAIKLGKLKDDSDDSYRQLRDSEHASLLNAIKAGEFEGNVVGGLMSLATITNPASVYAYTAMGLGALPGNIDKISNDIDRGDYLGAGVDTALTAASLLPAIGMGYKAGTKMYDAAKTFSKIKRGLTYYSGVPKVRKLNDGSYKLFDEFDSYDGLVWGTDNKKYADAMRKSFDWGEGVYNKDWEGNINKFMVDPKELKIKTIPSPKTGKAGASLMPYKYKASTDLIVLSEQETPTTMDVRGMGETKIAQPSYKGMAADESIMTSLNDIAKFSFNKGADAVKFDDMVDSDWLRRPFGTNTITLKPGTVRYNLGENDSKWTLFKPLYNKALSARGTTNLTNFNISSAVLEK